MSMTSVGRASDRRMKRSGEDGVAPEAISMAPAAITRMAPARGAAARTAGLNSRLSAISNLRNMEPDPCSTLARLRDGFQTRRIKPTLRMSCSRRTDR